MSENSLKSTQNTLQRIVDTVRELGDDHDAFMDAVQDDPLDISVRSDWHAPGMEKVAPDEFRILLTTGGPAIAIFGDLDHYGEPVSAVIRYQDWFEPWQSLPMTTEETKALLTYCRAFYFGE